MRRLTKFTVGIGRGKPQGPGGFQDLRIVGLPIRQAKVDVELKYILKTGFLPNTVRIVQSHNSSIGVKPQVKGPSSKLCRFNFAEEYFRRIRLPRPGIPIYARDNQTTACFDPRHSEIICDLPKEIVGVRQSVVLLLEASFPELEEEYNRRLKLNRKCRVRFTRGRGKNGYTQIHLYK